MFGAEAVKGGAVGDEGDGPVVEGGAEDVGVLFEDHVWEVDVTAEVQDVGTPVAMALRAVGGLVDQDGGICKADRGGVRGVAEEVVVAKMS